MAAKKQDPALQLALLYPTFGFVIKKGNTATHRFSLPFAFLVGILQAVTSCCGVSRAPGQPGFSCRCTPRSKQQTGDHRERPEEKIHRTKLQKAAGLTDKSLSTKRTGFNPNASSAGLEPSPCPLCQQHQIQLMTEGPNEAARPLVQADGTRFQFCIFLKEGAVAKSGRSSCAKPPPKHTAPRRAASAAHCLCPSGGCSTGCPSAASLSRFADPIWPASDPETKLWGLGLYIGPQKGEGKKKKQPKGMY